MRLLDDRLYYPMWNFDEMVIGEHSTWISKFSLNMIIMTIWKVIISAITHFELDFKIPVIIFRLNLEKYIKKSQIWWLRWIPGFWRIHPIYEFPENSQSDNCYFREKFQKSYVEWIRQNPRIRPSYSFCDFSSKNVNLGLKLDILKFLGIQPTIQGRPDWKSQF